MKIILNGDEKRLKDPGLGHLIDSLSLEQIPFALLINGTLIKKEHHNEVKLEEGDTVEIVSFVGGG